MKHLLLLILFSNITFASGIEIRIGAETDKGAKSENLRVGYNSEATYSIDNELNEYEAFDAPPVNDYGVFNLTFFQDSTQNAIVYSKNDFIPKQDNPFYHEHWIKYWMESNVSKTTISWTLPEEGIDSIYIVDEAGGVAFNVNMMENDSFTIDHDERPVYQWDFQIRVWYNPNITSIIEEENFSFNNKIVSILEFDSKYFGRRFKIYNLLGNVVDEGIISSNYYNLNHISDGAYFIVLENENGRLVNKFIKE